MAQTEPLFPRDHNYKAHYLMHRSLPPRWVQSKAENDYLIQSRLWATTYFQQKWPTTLYHKDFDITVDRAPDVEEFFNEKTGNVDERVRQAAITKRNKQRTRGIRLAQNQADIDKLGADWMPFEQLPTEQARLKQEAEDNAADERLFGGTIDPFLEEAEAEPAVVMGEPLRRGRRGAIV